MSLAERTLGPRHLSTVIRRARYSALRGLGTVALLLVVSYAVGVASVLVHLPAPFSVNSERSAVSSVTLGSYVWALHVRAGDAVQPWPSDQPDVGYTVDRGDGSTISIGERYDIASLDTLGMAAGLLLLAFVVVRVGLPGASVILGLSTAAALGPLAPALGYPVNLALAVLPPLTVTAYLAVAVVDRNRRTLIWFGLAVTVAVFVILVVAMLNAGFGWPWDLLYELPGLAVLFIAFASVWPHLVDLAHGPGSSNERTHSFIDALFPIARASRLTASADERGRIATEIHNVVLPSLGQAILEVDAQDPAGRERLTEVVNELRRSLSERQTAVLDRAGLLAAVRGYAASLRAHVDVAVTGTEDGRCRREVEFAAYRIAQLALVNAVEHSGGDSIRIQIDESRGELRMTVSDDGVGIGDEAEEEALARGHLGLADMRRAASAVGAQLTITGVADEGTTVSLWCRR